MAALSQDYVQAGMEFFGLLHGLSAKVTLKVAHITDFFFFFFTK